MPKYINVDQMLEDETEAYMKSQISLSRNGKTTTYMINEVVHKKIQQLLLDAPAEDVAPVIRCKDCRFYWYADNRVPDEREWVCATDGLTRPKLWYCADAERRTNEQTD